MMAGLGQRRLTDGGGFEWQLCPDDDNLGAVASPERRHIPDKVAFRLVATGFRRCLLDGGGLWDSGGVSWTGACI